MASEFRRVAVTGAAGYIGSQLIKRLECDESVELILATDIRNLIGRFSSKVKFLKHDITEPITSLISEYGIQAIAHLAYVIKPNRSDRKARRINVGGTANVLDACASSDVAHLVYLSSTTVYGAHPDNPDELSEDDPVRPVKGFQYGEMKAESERLLRDFAANHPDTSVTILRSCPILGPNADNFISLAFSKPFLLGIKGYDPPMQFLHEDDVENILEYCLLNRVSGIYNVGGIGTISWQEMVDLSGRRLIQMPAPLLYGLTSLTWKLRLQNESPPPGLDFIRYNWKASTDKIRRELGVEIKHSSRDAWEAFVTRTKLATKAEVSS